MTIEKSIELKYKTSKSVVKNKNSTLLQKNRKEEKSSIEKYLKKKQKIGKRLLNILVIIVSEVKVTQSCPTLCDPWTIQSREFSRPEYWSG